LLVTAVLATLVAVAGARAQGSDCLRYEPEDVSLAGTLQLQVFPGPPHYKSFDTGDQPESIWMLTLAKPMCIDATPGDTANTAAPRVERVQIVPRSSFSVSLNGKVAHVQGTLYRARAGHPHAEILLRATSVTPEGP
jgi:hypothetical protein